MPEDISLFKGPLSGSTAGKLIKIAATSSPGTTIHTTNATNPEKLWFKATNKHSSAVTVTIQWGGTSADDEWSFLLDPVTSPIEIVAGDVLGASSTVKVYASVTNVIFVLGEAIEISNTL